jgi:hypothetical protein
VVVRGVNEKVINRVERSMEDVNASEDTGKIPLVLVFEVGRGGPLVDPNRQSIVFGEMRGDVELGRVTTADYGAETMAVEPYFCPRLDPIKA